MTTPVRLQLSRKRGFNLQALSRATNGLDAVKVDRSTSLGNPFQVAKGTSTLLSVKAFRAWITSPENATALENAIHLCKNKNIACWCKPGTPCHADVLLEIANQ